MTNFQNLKGLICDKIKTITSYEELLNYLSKSPEEYAIIRSFSKEICLHCNERNNDSCNGECEKYCKWMYEEMK